ncbi:MAG: hypothetical protein GW914_03515, partial [Candidatus Aenigmarchaeota archaeon]|nr:hypothetical protein [Candidatus Aenigmarchaeota archaeon]
MIDINTIRCGRFSGKDIIDFEFTEGRLAKLENGWVKVGKVLSQSELNEFNIKLPGSRSLLNIYTASIFVGADIDIKHSITILKFDEMSNILDTLSTSITTKYSGTTLKTVSYNIITNS